MVAKRFTLVLSLFVLSMAASAQSFSKNICVGKSAQLFSVGGQLDVLTVNGVSSRRSTFWYKGQHSKLTLDFDRANVVAKCKSIGSDFYRFRYRVGGTVRINQVVGTVNCIYCVKASIKRLKDKIIQIGAKLRKVENPGTRKKLREQLYKITKKLEKEITKELENEELPEHIRSNLKQSGIALKKLQELVAEGDLDSEHFHYYLSYLNELM